MKLCTAPDCDKPVKYVGKGLCSAHGSRLARTGRLDARPPAVRKGPPSRSLPDYKSVAAAGHPLANTIGNVRVHRLTLWNKVGPGPQSCHWCGRVLQWIEGPVADRVCADHVDGDRLNNDPDNLVVACNRCNTGRARRPDYLTHCANGHPWTADNTLLRPSENARSCRTCNRERHAKAS